MWPKWMKRRFLGGEARRSEVQIDCELNGGSGVYATIIVEDQFAGPDAEELSRWIVEQLNKYGGTKLYIIGANDGRS